MTNDSKMRRRRLMHVTHNCMPRKIPLWPTLTLLLCADRWPDAQWIFFALGAVSWFMWFISEFFGQPVDIFEHYRNMPTLDDVV